MSVSTKNAFAALRLDDDEASESVESTPAKEGAAKWGFGDASWADGCVGVMRRAAESTPAALWLSDSLTPPGHWHSSQRRQRGEVRPNRHVASDT